MEKNSPANARAVRDAGIIPESGTSAGGGNDNPFKYSCLEYSMDKGAWWATVHGVAKSQTPPKQLSAHTHPTESLNTRTSSLLSSSKLNGAF